MPKRLLFHAGNRGSVLAILGVIWLVMGTVVHQGPKPVLLHERLPLWATLLMWSLPGAIAVAAGWWRQFDATGWGLLFVGPMVRVGSYFWGYVTGAYPPAGRGLIVWVAVAFLINRCAAGLDRPPPWDGRERRTWTQQEGP